MLLLELELFHARCCSGERIVVEMLHAFRSVGGSESISAVVRASALFCLASSLTHDNSHSKMVNPEKMCKISFR